MSMNVIKTLLSYVVASVMALMLLVVLPQQSKADTTNPNAVRLGLGSVSNSGFPIAFFQGFDGNLWEAYSTGSVFNVANLGTPSATVGISSAVSADVYTNGHPEVFVIGTEQPHSHLWQKYWAYPNGPWVWQDLGTPTSTVGITTAIGSAVYANGCSEVFVIGTDGHLWQKYWAYPSGPWLWQDLGVPSASVGIAKAVGTDVYAPGHSEVFVIGTDGHLWQKVLGQSAWNDLGTPPSNENGNVGIAMPVGSDVYTNGYSEVFIIGTDGHLWQKYFAYPSGPWTWQDLGTPANNIKVVGALGHDVYANGCSEIFVVGTDGHVWQKYWTYPSGPWAWRDLGTPSRSVGIAGSVGSAPNNGKSLLFVIGTDSNLWTLQSDGSMWYWSNITNQDVSPSYIYPKYKILGIDYAPPGNKSYVKYEEATSRGSSSTISNSSSVKIDISNEFSFFGLVSTRNNLSYAYQTDRSASNSYTLTTASSTTLAGSSLGLNHDNDIIWLWLNPAAKITQTGPNSIRWGGYTTNPSDTWIGTDSDGNVLMDVIPLSVYQLKNPSSITDPYLLSSLSRGWDTTGVGGMTSDDYATILASNPFVSNPSFDPNVREVDGSRRYDPIGVVVSYGQGTGITTNYSIMNSSTSKEGKGSQYSYSLGLSVSGSAVIIKSSSSSTFTFTDKWTSEVSNTNTKTASLSIAGPTLSDPPYTGPTQFQVWRDNVYGSYMFNPVLPR